MQNEHHEMELLQTYPTGAEKWQCLHCDRQFVMQWQPYKKIVLKEGDEQAYHSGGKGGVQLKPLHLTETQSDAEADDLSADLRSALDDFMNTLNW